MRIEFGGEDVIDELVEIVNAAYRRGEAGLWEPGWARTDHEGMERLVATGEIAVARKDRTPIGCVRVRLIEPRVSMFGMLSVAESALGTGVGRELIAFSEAVFDVDEVELELLVPHGAPHPDKVKLDGWYQRLGYRVIGRRDFAEPLLIAPADLVVYRKSLRAAPATDAPPRALT